MKPSTRQLFEGLAFFRIVSNLTRADRAAYYRQSRQCYGRQRFRERIKSGEISGLYALCRP